ncbi:winged helix DNA-binding protein [Novosphingobium sp.]|uniref:winged helix DNA-binding protein n=1 Tax=Novosphingobium sp. TaxID=1874826 RepID=UPI00260286B3|nr:winged helix DNA-binding protein [Novosphingobium sp.]
MSGRIIRRHDRGRRRAVLRRASPAALAEATAVQDPLGDADRVAVPDATASVAAALHESSARITPEALLAFARETYAIRRRRDRHLPGDLFGEPTWDILLDLYVATREGRPVPTTSACIGANVPPTTALRWLRILEARGLVEREDDGRDGRRTFVRLSARGLAAMDNWLQVALATLDHAVGPILRRSMPLAEAAE